MILKNCKKKEKKINLVCKKNLKKFNYPLKLVESLILDIDSYKDFYRGVQNQNYIKKNQIHVLK